VHNKTAEGIAREVGRRADSPFGRSSPLRVASPNSAFNSTSSPPMDLKLMVALAGLANLKLGCARKHTSLHRVVASASQGAEQCQTRLVIYACFLRGQRSPQIDLFFPICLEARDAHNHTSIRFRKYSVHIATPRGPIHQTWLLMICETIHNRLQHASWQCPSQVTRRMLEPVACSPREAA
jgi:hypothetical protein